MKNKKGAIDEGMLTIYRMVLVTIIAFFILGVSAFVYSYYLDVRDAEAVILAKKVITCLAPEGVVDLSALEPFEDTGNFLQEYCNLKGIERFYVNVKFSREVYGLKTREDIFILEQGEDNLGWLAELSKQDKSTKNIKKYVPGYLESSYTPIIFSDNKKGGMVLYVVVSPESFGQNRVITNEK